jgi:hypothetical protein
LFFYKFFLKKVIHSFDYIYLKKYCKIKIEKYFLRYFKEINLNGHKFFKRSGPKKIKNKMAAKKSKKAAKKSSKKRR